MLRATVNRLGARLGHGLADVAAELAVLAQDAPERIRQEWELFQEIFKKTPVKRTGFEGLKRNIRFLNEGTLGSSSGEGESVE